MNVIDVLPKLPKGTAIDEKLKMIPIPYSSVEFEAPDALTAANAREISDVWSNEPAFVVIETTNGRYPYLDLNKVAPSNIVEVFETLTESFVLNEETFKEVREEYIEDSVWIDGIDNVCYELEKMIGEERTDGVDRAEIADAILNTDPDLNGDKAVFNAADIAAEIVAWL